MYLHPLIQSEPDRNLHRERGLSHEWAISQPGCSIEMLLYYSLIFNSSYSDLQVTSDRITRLSGGLVFQGCLVTLNGFLDSAPLEATHAIATGSRPLPVASL
jgi:hypothetical protein